MADPFGTMVQNLQNMGFFQYLFPFLLAFAILYGALQWVFKEGLGGRRVHALISIVVAFFVMFYSASNPWMYQFLTTTSGTWLGLATVVLFLVVLLALAGVDIHKILSDEKRSWVKYLIILIVIYIVLASFLGYGVLTPFIPSWLSYNDLWTVILVIIILAIVFWFVGGEGEKPAGEPEKGPGRAGEAPAREGT
jgi:accessory gene regulator protein AgrB